MVDEKAPPTKKGNLNLVWPAAVGTVVVVALFFVAAGLSNKPNAGIKDAAAALVLITAVAVGIERVLELFWTFIDTTAGTFWPLTAVDAAINDFAREITDAAQGPLRKLSDSLGAVEKTANWTDEQVIAAKQEIENLGQKIGQLQQLAPNSDNVRMIVAVATAGLKKISTRYPAIKDNVDLATQAVGAVDDFVDSLTDNPGRRIISIYGGVFLGMLIASVLALDVFNATLGTIIESPVPFLSGATFKWGVALTGLAMGLGSNPTHELIQALQSYKQSRASSQSA